MLPQFELVESDQLELLQRNGACPQRICQILLLLELGRRDSTVGAETEQTAAGLFLQLLLDRHYTRKAAV